MNISDERKNLWKWRVYFEKLNIRLSLFSILIIFPQSLNVKDPQDCSGIDRNAEYGHNLTTVFHHKIWKMHFSKKNNDFWQKIFAHHVWSSTSPSGENQLDVFLKAGSECKREYMHPSAHYIKTIYIQVLTGYNTKWSFERPCRTISKTSEVLNITSVFSSNFKLFFIYCSKSLFKETFHFAIVF